MSALQDWNSVSQVLRSGYGLAFLLVLISFILVFISNEQLDENINHVVDSNKVMTELETIVSDLKDAETGFRGYIVIKDKVFLAPYYASEKNISKTLGELRSNTIGNNVHKKALQAKLDTLNLLIGQKINIMKQGMHLFEDAGQVLTDSLKNLAYIGKAKMDEIRSIVGKMINIEEDYIAESNDLYISQKSTIKTINIVALAIATLMIIYSILIFDRENRLKRQAGKQVVIYKKELEVGAAELQTANAELVELKRNEKFLVTGRIARTIAHEVKNPLTNINLAAEQLKDLVKQDEESDLLFDMITRNANRINQLVTDLLNSTKIAEPKFDRLSINTILDEALVMAGDSIELNSIIIEKKYTPDICDVSADKEQIKIALLNLLVNAIEAMEPGKGILELRTENKNNKCMVTIADNGTGMAEEDLSKLFEPYFTSKPKGTGLGLTHTQSIILNHKGSIQVSSEKGKGTKFEISLDFA